MKKSVRSLEGWFLKLLQSTKQNERFYLPVLFVYYMYLYSAVKIWFLEDSLEVMNWIVNSVFIRLKNFSLKSKHIECFVELTK